MLICHEPLGCVMCDILFIGIAVVCFSAGIWFLFFWVGVRETRDLLAVTRRHLEKADDKINKLQTKLDKIKADLEEKGI